MGSDPTLQNWVEAPPPYFPKITHLYLAFDDSELDVNKGESKGFSCWG